MINLQSPALILVRGLPGSGKSYLSIALAHALKPHHAIVLDPDAIDYDSKLYQALHASLTEEGLAEAIHPFRFLRGQAQEALVSGSSVIWNQAFTHKTIFNNLINFLVDHAKENGTIAHVYVIEVSIDHDTARARVADRATQGGHDVPEERFEQFFRDYESFEDLGYHTVSINGACSLDDNIERILNAIAED